MRKTQLQALLVIGAIGAALAMIHLLGAAGGFAGLALMLAASILTAPAAPQSGEEGVNWWALIAGGTALALVGVPLELVLEAVGGLLTVAGGGLVIVGVAFGLP